MPFWRPSYPWQSEEYPKKTLIRLHGCSGWSQSVGYTCTFLGNPVPGSNYLISLLICHEITILSWERLLGKVKEVRFYISIARYDKYEHVRSNQTFVAIFCNGWLLGVSVFVFLLLLFVLCLYLDLRQELRAGVRISTQGAQCTLEDCCLSEISSPRHMAWYCTQSHYTDSGPRSSDS